MTKILISSVGSLVGQNVLDALTNRRQNLHIAGTNSVADAANNFRCDSMHLVSPAAELENFTADLVRLIKQEQPGIIIPGRDDDIEIVASIREQYFPDSQSFLCGSVGFASIMADKVKSSAFAQAHQLPFAASLETGLENSRDCAQQLVEEYGFPLIAKPKRGYGSLGIWVVCDDGQLDEVCKLDDYALQPLIGHDRAIHLETTYGLPFVWAVPENSLYAAQVLIDRQGKIISSLGFVSTMVMGKCERISKVDDPELTQAAHDFAEQAIACGWRGPFNIQFKKDPDHGYQAIEMNGRFSGGTSARRHLGLDEVRLLLNEWAGEEIIPDDPELLVTRTVARSLTDFPIPAQHAETLETRRTWMSDTQTNPQ